MTLTLPTCQIGDGTICKSPTSHDCILVGCCVKHCTCITTQQERERYFATHQARIIAYHQKYYKLHKEEILARQNERRRRAKELSTGSKQIDKSDNLTYNNRGI